MSRVYLLAADHILPLCSCGTEKTRCVNGVSITMASGFAVEPHVYYRDAVDALGYAMKPFRFELSLDDDETDLGRFRAYLQAHLAPGESVELWSVWVGNGGGTLRRFRGCFAEFDMASMEMLFEEGQTCLTVQM